jgi:hypothetical protein
LSFGFESHVTLNLLILNKFFNNSKPLDNIFSKS